MHVQDQISRLQVVRNIDPETGAVIQVREDGFLKIDYIDGSYLMIYDDHTRIHVEKRPGEQEETRITNTYFEKDGYATIKTIFDPVKARAATIIGQGGADALMGRDGIMERSNTGQIIETYLPCKSVVFSYMENQELPGVN